MKIKIKVSSASLDYVLKEVELGNLEVCNDSRFYLAEEDNNDIIGYTKRKEIVLVDKEDIIYIDCYDHDISIITRSDIFKSKNTLSELERILDSKDFIRVSKSCIVCISEIEKMIPMLGLKMKLIMSNKDVVYVSRSYFYFFKEAIGF